MNIRKVTIPATAIKGKTMTEVQSEANGAKQKRVRTKKVDMPYSFKFLDEKNVESDHIPSNVTIVKVVLANGNALTLDLKAIPVATAKQLQADAIKRLLASKYLKDLTKETVAQAAGLTEEFVKAMRANTLYVPSERGGGPGRVFDFDFWVEVAARVAKARVDANLPKAKLMSDKERAGFRAKLEGMTSDERKAKKDEWDKNPLIKKVAAALRVEREASKATEDSADMMI